MPFRPTYRDAWVVYFPRAALPKERLEVTAGTDPAPDNGVALALGDRAVLLVELMVACY